MQTTNYIFLVRPQGFSFNEQTAESNTFQNKLNPEGLGEKAQAEFDQFQEKLAEKGINVTVFEDSAAPVKPDAVFPNNWISLHKNGLMILYPMNTENRRTERRPEIIESLKEKFNVNQVLDLTHYELEGKFLEGTGSIIFDHDNKIAYACLSPRTHQDLFLEVTDFLKYKPVSFYAYDKKGVEIYHTNVMMALGPDFCVICLESIRNEAEKEKVVKSLTETGHEIIDITLDQVQQFAGNMLALKTNEGKTLLVMSDSARQSLDQNQVEQLEKYAELVPLSISTIETVGGGSVRCMIAEIFSEPK